MFSFGDEAAARVSSIIKVNNSILIAGIMKFLEKVDLERRLCCDRDSEAEHLYRIDCVFYGAGPDGICGGSDAVCMGDVGAGLDGANAAALRHCSGPHSEVGSPGNLQIQQAGGKADFWRFGAVAGNLPVSCSNHHDHILSLS